MADRTDDLTAMGDQLPSRSLTLVVDIGVAESTIPRRLAIYMTHCLFDFARWWCTDVGHGISGNMSFTSTHVMCGRSV